MASSVSAVDVSAVDLPKDQANEVPMEKDPVCGSVGAIDGDEVERQQQVSESFLERFIQKLEQVDHCQCLGVENVAMEESHIPLKAIHNQWLTSLRLGKFHLLG